jgi:hypothetical protein
LGGHKNSGHGERQDANELKNDQKLAQGCHVESYVHQASVPENPTNRAIGRLLTKVKLLGCTPVVFVSHLVIVIPGVFRGAAGSEDLCAQFINALDTELLSQRPRIEHVEALSELIEALISQLRDH